MPSSLHRQVTVVVPSGKYFGKYYQDIQKRVPSIANAKKRLGWNPKVGLKKAIKLTLDYHLAHKDYQLELGGDYGRLEVGACLQAIAPSAGSPRFKSPVNRLLRSNHAPRAQS